MDYNQETNSLPSDLEAHQVVQIEQRIVFENFFWHRLRSDYVCQAIRQYAGASPTVLDVGAGGVFGIHFKQKFLQGCYAFIEPLGSLSRQLCFEYSDSSDWTKKKEYVASAVVLLDVLEHQRNDVKFLMELGAKLRANTLVVITCPALTVLWSDRDIKQGHFRRYTRRSLERVVEAAGLEVLYSDYLFQAMILPGLFRRWKKKSDDAEFPIISKKLNQIIYHLGKVERAFFGWLPFGSSIAVVCRKKG